MHRLYKEETGLVEEELQIKEFYQESNVSFSKQVAPQMDVCSESLLRWMTRPFWRCITFAHSAKTLTNGRCSKPWLNDDRGNY